MKHSLYSRHLLHSLHRLQLLDECLKARRVVDVHDKVAAEESVVAVYADAAEREFLVLAYDARDVVHDADIVIAHDTQRDGIHRRALAAPSRLHDAVAEALAQLRGVGTVATVYLDASVDGDEAEDLIAIYRLAAFSQLEVDALQIAVDDEHVIAALLLLCVRALHKVEVVGTLCGLVAYWILLTLLEFEITVDDGIHVQRTLGYLFVEVACLLEFQLLYQLILLQE